MVLPVVLVVLVVLVVEDVVVAEVVEVVVLLAVSVFLQDNPIMIIPMASNEAVKILFFIFF